MYVFDWLTIDEDGRGCRSRNSVLPFCLKPACFQNVEEVSIEREPMKVQFEERNEPPPFGTSCHEFWATTMLSRVDLFLSKADCKKSMRELMTLERWVVRTLTMILYGMLTRLMGGSCWVRNYLFLFFILGNVCNICNI